MINIIRAPEPLQAIPMESTPAYRLKIPGQSMMRVFATVADAANYAKSRQTTGRINILDREGFVVDSIEW